MILETLRVRADGARAEPFAGASVGFLPGGERERRARPQDVVAAEFKRV